MPHATSPQDSQEELDDILIRQTLDSEIFLDSDTRLDFSGDLEPGEKAEGAIDFADLGDDDLADDESDGLLTELVGHGSLLVSSLKGLKSHTQNKGFPEPIEGEPSEEDGIDDLFGDNISSHREDDEARRPSLSTPSIGTGFTGRHYEDLSIQEHSRLPPEEPPTQIEPRQDALVQSQAVFQPTTFDVQDKLISKEQQLQQELFAMSGYGLSSIDYLPPPPANQEELLRSLWPKYERDSVPRFMELLPPKKTPYNKKIPPKRPKSFQPTKLNLELAKDSEKSFRLPGNSFWRKGDDLGIIYLADSATRQESMRNPENVDIDPESDISKQFTLQDIQILCENWESQATVSCHGATETDTMNPPTDYDLNMTNQLEVHVSKVGAISIDSISF